MTRSFQNGPGRHPGRRAPSRPDAKISHYKPGRCPALQFRIMRMTRLVCTLFVLVLSAVAVRADLVLEQKFSDTNSTHTAVMKIHGNQMRMDEPDAGLSVI